MSDQRTTPAPSLPLIVAGLDEALARIGRAFAEDADKWEADKQLALEEVERTLQRVRDLLPDEKVAALGDLPLWKGGGS